MSYLQRLVFVRKEGINVIEHLALVEVLMHDPEASQEEVIRSLKAAVTDWVKETPEGKQAWEASSEDFNIGDYFCYGPEKLRPFLQRHGIVDLFLRYQMCEGRRAVLR
jgi:hypothetical protein